MAADGGAWLWQDPLRRRMGAGGGQGGASSDRPSGADCGRRAQRYGGGRIRHSGHFARSGAPALRAQQAPADVAQRCDRHHLFGRRAGTPARSAARRGMVRRGRRLALVRDPICVVTRGSSYENRANLAPAFFDQIIRKYEGTRLGRQELQAELLEDTPGALWSHGSIEASRLRSAPAMTRVVVAIYPAVTSGDEADETGIIVAGKDH